VKASGIIGAVVIGASLVLAAVVFALVGELLRSAGQTETQGTLARLERQVGEQAERLARLEGEIGEVRREAEALGERVAAGTPATLPVPEIGALPSDQFGGDAPLPDTEGLVDPMQLAAGRFNHGIQRPTPSLMRELLGEPRQAYTQDCLPVTNPRLIEALDTRQVGAFRVTMLRPALDSFEQVMDRLRREEPAIYDALGTAGALCARYVRGSSRSVSSHAWGAAVDLTLTGDLDRMGDDATQFGLVVLAEFFNAAGWYWGAGYGREDSMHFEPGEALLRQWIAEGRM
jgi:hypothetical protein